MLANPTRRSTTPLFAVVVAAILLSMLPLSSARAAAPAFVQTKFAQVASGTTDSAAFSTANAAGNLIVAYVVWSSATSSVSLSDTRGNTYASAGPVTKWNGTAWSSQVFYAKNIAAGTNTVKATFSATISGFGLLYVHEYSGIDSTNPLDTAAAATGTTSAMSSGAATPSNASDLIFGAGASTSSITTKGAGFTSRSTSSGNLTEDRLSTAAGATAATATHNGSAWVMHMVAFKAATATTADTVAPSVPTGLAATATSTTQVGLTWTASTDNVGVTGYRVFRSGSQVGTSTSASYSDGGLAPGTAYTYAVAAVDAAGNVSAQSTTASVTTLVPPPDTTAPSVPAGLTATTISGTEIDLAWSASTDAVGVTGYRIFRDGSPLTTATTRTYKDTGLTPGSTHTYAVSAYDAATNESQPSTSVSATTTAPDTPHQVCPPG